MAHLRPIDKEFEEADDTGVLVLSSRNLRNFPVVPGDLCDYNDLLEADFTNNRFDHIPNEVCDFSQLVKLCFYRNLLRLVPEELKHLYNLKDLNLSRNLLPTIPVGLCQMNLHSLNLSNNKLVSLPLPLGNLKQLRYLNLSCNHLPDLPTSIVELSSLQHLDLHRNQLRELPSDIQMLALRYLDVSCNHITALPTTLRHITDTLQIFKIADNPIEAPPTHVCVRGLMHIVKWMEGLEKHGSDPHLLCSTSSSRDASLARRKAKRHSTTRSYVDSVNTSGNENGVLNLDDVTNKINSSLKTVESPSQFAKHDGEITPTHTSTPMHWSVAQYRNTPGSAMSDQSKEEYREAAHKLYMQQERQMNRMNRRKRSSSPIQATAKAAVALSKQQSGSTEFTPLSHQRSSKEELTSTQSAQSPTGGTKSLGGSPRVVPVARSLPGERNPRPGSWNSHVKVTSSPILPSKYAMPAGEKPVEDDSSSGGTSSNRGEPVEEVAKEEVAKEVVVKKEVVKKVPPPIPQNKPEPSVVRRNISSDAVQTKVPLEEIHKKPPPVETAGATPPSSSPSSREANQSGSGNRRERSPAPHFDRSDSVTPTNEVVDEESLTPRSKMGPKDPSQTLTAASKKLQEELSDKLTGSVSEDGGSTQEEKPAPNGVAGVSKTEEKKEKVEEEGGEKKEWRQSLQEDQMIQTLNTSPKARRHLSSESDVSESGSKNSTWQRSLPPRKKKEKDVFKFLKDTSAANYTVRRQEFQISRVIEKSRVVREKIEEVLGMELAEDIGEWVGDGMVLCKLVKKLHPQLMPSFHTASQGKELSRGRKTVNIANFIAACRQLHVPEEELCSAGDIIELKDPVRVITCLQRVLESADINILSP